MPHRVDFTSCKILFYLFKNANVKIKDGIIVAINQQFKLSMSSIQHLQSK